MRKAIITIILATFAAWLLAYKFLISAADWSEMHASMMARGNGYSAAYLIGGVIGQTLRWALDDLITAIAAGIAVLIVSRIIVGLVARVLFRRLSEAGNEKPDPLRPCPDCKKVVSINAESCVHCGSVFIKPTKTVLVANEITVSGTNWVLRIAFGVIMSGVILIALTAAFWFLVFVVLLGAAASVQK